MTQGLVSSTKRVRHFCRTLRLAWLASDPFCYFDGGVDESGGGVVVDVSDEELGVLVVVVDSVDVVVVVFL